MSKLYEKVELYIQAVRLKAWVSKFPGFIVAVFCMLIASKEIESSILFWSLVFLIGHLATGYIANDIADWELDLSSDDKRDIHQLTKSGAYAYFGFWLILHMLTNVYMAIAFQPWVIIVFILLLLFHMAFSFFPRLKSLGIIGVISSAFYQWVAPFLVYFILTSVQVSGSNPILPILLILWLFVVGCNGAIRHQLHDYYRDSGKVKNLVQQIGVEKASKLLPLCQALSAIIPGLSFLFLAPTDAFSITVCASSFAVYHTMYYKRLKTYGLTFARK